MYPKALQQLCIDYVVDATVAYQNTCNNVKKLWTGLQRAWNLPPTALSRCHPLLHSYLVHHTSSAKRHDITKSLLTLLAIKIDRISFTQLQPVLSCLSFPSALFKCEVFTVDHSLSHLDLTGVDLAESTDPILTSLLPQCPSLSVLKLGGNTTPRVLFSAQNCPLSVLHICERQVYSPRVTILALIDSILGCGDLTLNQLFEQVQAEKPLDLKLFWPNLIDLNTGYCRLPIQLLLMVLIIYPSIEYLWSNIFGTLKVLSEFENLAKNLPGKHILSLKERGEIERDMGPSFEITPNIEELHIRTDTQGNVISEALTHRFPYLRSLVISLKTSEFPSFLDSKIANTSEITSIKLIGSSYISLHVRVIMSISKLFPSLERLYVNSYKELIFSPSPGRPELQIFNSVTYITAVLENLDEPLFYTLSKFPHLNSLSITSKNLIPNRFWDCLSELPHLRVLKLSVPNCSIYIDSLCQLPSKTDDKKEWVLYSSLRYFSRDNVKRLRKNGWAFYPLNEKEE